MWNDDFSQTLNGRTALGRIVSVDARARTCTVRTIGLPGSTNDLHLRDVKFLHLNWHPDGEEETTVPRIGTYGVILFVNSEPFICGYYPLSLPSGAVRANQEDLAPGDKIIKATAGNQIIVRGGGTVQVESTKGCRTYWIPNQDVINTVCKNLETTTAGGFAHWTLDKDTYDTVMKFVAWNNLEATSVVKLEVGATGPEADAATRPVIDLQMGPANEEAEIEKKHLSLQVLPSGATTLEIGEQKLKIEIKETGETTLNIGPGKMTLKITPEGAVTMTAEDAVSVTAKKAVSITAEGDLALSGKDISLKASGKLSMEASGEASLKGSKTKLGKGTGAVLTKISDPLTDNVTGAPSVGVEDVLA